MASFSSLRKRVEDREQKREFFKTSLQGLSAYDRHKKFIVDYVNFYKQGQQKDASSSSSARPIRTDHDTLRETYRFIRTEEDDAGATWEQRLARRYYNKLFREYCLADMTRYKENAIGLRWRTEQEVITGKGQFICGAKGCNERQGLRSFEVNFSYREEGQLKQALVKLRVCPKHSYQLNYRKEKEMERKQRREEKEKRKEKERQMREERRPKRRRRDGDTSVSDTVHSPSSSPSSASEDDSGSHGLEKHEGGGAEESSGQKHSSREGRGRKTALVAGAAAGGEGEEERPGMGANKTRGMSGNGDESNPEFDAFFSDLLA